MANLLLVWYVRDAVIGSTLLCYVTLIEFLARLEFRSVSIQTIDCELTRCRTAGINNECRSPVKYSGNHLIGAVGISNERAGGGNVWATCHRLIREARQFSLCRLTWTFFWLLFFCVSPVAGNQSDGISRRNASVVAVMPDDGVCVCARSLRL